MINRRLYYVLCVIITTSCCDCLGKNLNEFLMDKFVHVNDALGDEIANQAIRTMDTEIEFYNSNSTALPKNYENVHIFTLFETTYVVTDADLYKVTPSNDSVSLEPSGIFFKIEDKLSFVKTTEYDEMGFVLLCYQNGVSNVYIVVNNTDEINLQQSIQSDVEIRDAAFFTAKTSLYLFISSGDESNLKPSILYKWQGTYFDEIDQILLVTTSKITTFSTTDSEIIIVLQNYKKVSTILEFKETLKKSQLLTTKAPKHVLTYIFKNSTYVVVFDDKSVLIHSWDGSELINIGKLDSPYAFEKISVMYTDKFPVILATTKEELIIYTPTKRGIRLSSKSKYDGQFKTINDFSIIKYHNRNIALILGQAVNNTSYTFVYFSLYVTIRDEDIEVDPILQCFNNLEKQLIATQDHLNLLENKSENILQLNEPTEFDGKITLSTPLVAQVSNIDTLFPTTKYFQDKLRMEDTINKINQKIDELLSKLENVFHYNDQVLNEKLIIKGQLYARNLKAHDINVAFLNSKRWTPERWLSYSSPQTITGFAKINKLVTKELLVPKQGTVFNDLLLSIGNQRISGLVTFKSLKTSKFFTTAINDIPRENIYLRSNPIPIKGMKQFPNMKVTNIEMDYLNDQNASVVIKLFADPKSHKYVFGPVLKIENLSVETINGVHWDTFKNSAFLVGKTNKISGTLSMVRAKIDKLSTEFVNGMNISDLLTTTSNQTITSNIKFSNIKARNVNCNKINDVRIPDDVVFINGNNTVKGPVIIDNVHILETLKVNGVDKSNLKLNGNHIIGTDEKDLLQIYNNKVKIIGNVHIENVLRSDAILILNGSEFTLNEIDDYWLKNKRQTIPVHVYMQNGMSTSHLKTKLLNGVEISNYMLDDLDDKQRTKFHFENVTVLGNVTVNRSEKHYPNFTKIGEESVKYNGNYTVSGEKRFKGKLIVDNLSVNYLNDIRVDEVVTINSEEILGSLFFENLLIKGNLSTKTANVNNINEENLNELYNKTILIDKPAHFKNLQFDDVIAKNLYTPKINDKSFDEYVQSIKNVYALDTLERVEILGNIFIRNTHNLSYINNVDTQLISKKISGEPLMEGKVTFTDTIFVKNFRASVINDINMESLLNALFYRNWDQNIPGKQRFNIVRTNNLVASVINDKNIENLINVEERDPQELIVKDVLHLHTTKFLKSLNVNNTTCDMRIVANNLLNPPTRNWESMTFLKNISFLNGNLNYILENAVTTEKNNTINAPVTFQQVSTKIAKTAKNINNVDIQAIYDDALLKYENDQLVTGRKTMIYMTAAGATVSGNAEIPVINGIKILDVNKTIVHKNHVNNVVIKGHKHFAGGLQTNLLNTRLISGIEPENFVSLSNLQTIPLATFDYLHVAHNFDVNFINGVNFSNFIANRLLKNHPTEQIMHGKYYFDNIQIYGDATIPKINEINLDDVVFDVGVQKIPTPKTFQQHVVVYHNIDVGELNGINISEAYDQSILLNRNETIDGNIKLNRVAHVSKNMLAENINGVPVHYIKELLVSETPKAKANIAFDTIDKIEKILKRNWNIVNELPQKYMYLEKSTEFQINIPNTVSAQIVESKGHVMIHVIGEAPGPTCGLPNNCNCPTQITLQITPEFSSNTFAKKSTQRVYSYENDFVTIHVITYSVSSNFVCRNNSSLLHEYTTITWNTISSGKFTGKSAVYATHITGYVTGVEFFRLNGYAYVIIGIFYDPVKNTHNLNNLVFRLNPEKNEIEMIQEIPTKGSWTLHLFHTSQGINLIIGNIFDSNHIYSTTNTDIYRFNIATQRFELLRSVPGTGCISATGVVMGLDSLIVLALNGAPTPMLVLKYNHLYDNYYLYQSFGLDSPILDVSAFYIGGPGISDVYLSAVTETGGFYVYTFRNIQGWKLESQGQLDGLRSLIPFVLNKKTYLFAPSTKMSSLLTVVKNGDN